MRHDPYSGMDPRVRGFLDTLARSGAPPIHTLPPAEARKVLLQAQAGPVDKLHVDIQEHRVGGGPDGQFAITILRPEDLDGPLPVVMYFHGGGWVLGNLSTHDRLVRELAHGAEAAVVFVHYSPSPEARYPVAIEQAYAATRFITDRGRGFGLDATRLAVAGDSVGGNMAAVVALLARKRGGPRIKHQVLFYPVTDAGFDTDSYARFADGHFLTADAMRWFWDQYLPDRSLRRLPTAAPLHASRHDLAHLPPALIITAERDVLRDEGEAYAHHLVDAGVEVTATRYLGTIHDFVMLNALAETPAARAAITEATTVLRDALAAPVSRRITPDVEVIHEYAPDQRPAPPPT